MMLAVVLLPVIPCGTVDLSRVRNEVGVLGIPLVDLARHAVYNPAEILRSGLKIDCRCSPARA
jgi:hypothetical protein